MNSAHISNLSFIAYHSEKVYVFFPVKDFFNHDGKIFQSPILMESTYAPSHIVYQTLLMIILIISSKLYRTIE